VSFLRDKGFIDHQPGVGLVATAKFKAFINPDNAPALKSTRDQPPAAAVNPSGSQAQSSDPYAADATNAGSWSDDQASDNDEEEPVSYPKKSIEEEMAEPPMQGEPATGVGRSGAAPRSGTSFDNPFE